MDFKKVEELDYTGNAVTTEAFAEDLLRGFIDPEHVLADKAQTQAVQAAIDLLNRFMGEAKEAGVVEDYNSLY